MSGSLNKVTIIGNLGADPEFKSFQSGDEVCNLSVATSETWKDKATGEKKEKVEWHRVTVFGEGMINVCRNYVRKGTKIYIEGALQTRKWEQDGQTRYATEVCLRPYSGKIILLGGKPDNASGSPASAHDQAKQNGFQPEAGGDDIPF